MSYAPRHRKVEPNSLITAVAGRHGKALTGMAIAVPTVVAGVGMAAPASAAPVALAPQTATAVAQATAAPALTSYTSVTVLRYGSRGSLVVTLQKRLGISADGSFGPGTLRSVKSFQSRKGLAADGVVGPITWRALGGYPTTTTAASRSTNTSIGSRAVSVAYRYVGVPYVYGGSTPSGFDCSGLTGYVYRQLGIGLQRSARAQQASVRRVSSPIPGDLVFYGYPAYHVGLYIGGGKMIAAPKPGQRVQVQAVYGPALNNYGRPY